MVGSPDFPITPDPAPDGSSSVDTTYSITSSNLALLSDVAKSSLLSASNIGSAITSRINSTLDLVGAIGGFTAYLLDETVLNGLASGASSSTVNCPNVGTSESVRLIVILGEISVGAGAKVQVSDGSTSYELTLPATNSEKRLEFNSIPAAFVNSFSVVNNTGVTLASWGNSIIVIPL